MNDDIKLPPLPEPDQTVDIFGHDVDLFTKSKLRDYARAAVLADRQQRGEPVGVRVRHKAAAAEAQQAEPDVEPHWLWTTHYGRRGVDTFTKAAWPDLEVQVLYTAPQPAKQRSEPVARVGRDMYGVMLDPLVETPEAIRALDALQAGTLLYTAPQPAKQRSEPVAWMSEDGNRLAHHRHRDYTVPLYTAPQPAEREARDAEVASLTREIAARDARIDALMLEHCPDEMTPEQLERWAAHQAPVSNADMAAVDAAIAAQEADRG